MNSRPDISPPVGYPPRPLLGLRRKPGRLALAVFRMPLNAYRHDAGWMLGRTFLGFTHTGRKTGQPHDAVAMVLHYDGANREAVICSAWGPDTDWLQNLRAHPAVAVRLARLSFTPTHRLLTDGEAFDVVVQFRSQHPHRLRLIASIFGWGDLRDDDVAREFVRTHPFVAFRPAGACAQVVGDLEGVGDGPVESQRGCGVAIQRPTSEQFVHWPSPRWSRRNRPASRTSPTRPPSAGRST